MKILLLGAPGSGKGTISELLIKNHNFKHISTGNLFRAILSSNKPLSAEIKDLMQRGDLIPDAITNQVAFEALKDLIAADTSFILDGYPRTLNQAQFLSEHVSLDYVFYLDVNEQLIINRITGRLSCLDCNKVYNIHFKVPKTANLCDDCETPLYKRPDDNEQAVKHRLAEYNKQTHPLVEYYRNQNKLIEIDANQDQDNIYKELLAYITNENKK